MKTILITIPQTTYSSYQAVVSNKLANELSKLEGKELYDEVITLLDYKMLDPIEYGDYEFSEDIEAETSMVVLTEEAAASMAVLDHINVEQYIR